MMKYICIIPARNEEKTIVDTIKMLSDQSILPERIYAINDGSKDRTGRLLKSCSLLHRHLELSPIILINRPDRGFSALGTYLMADVYNDAWKPALKEKDWDYALICAPDTILSRNYCESLILRMENGGYSVAGGFPSGSRLSNCCCRGSGRMIRRDVLEALNGFPRSYGWESSVFQYSWMKGYKTGHFTDVRFILKREKNKNINYINWGRGMKDLGCHPLQVLCRSILVTILDRNPLKAIRLIVGYFSHRVMIDSDYRRWCLRNFKFSMIGLILNILIGNRRKNKNEIY